MAAQVVSRIISKTDKLKALEISKVHLFCNKLDRAVMNVSHYIYFYMNDNILTM